MNSSSMVNTPTSNWRESGCEVSAAEVSLPAEWSRHSFVQLTWPHSGSDWAPMLDEVCECYRQMAAQIARFTPLLIVAPPNADLHSLLPDHPNLYPRISVVNIATNDTWARDHAFITTVDSHGRHILNDYQFNGWGMKFAANLDNRINRRLADFLTSHDSNAEYRSQLDFVLEGGSIESDGQGTLLTTTSCLLAPNRNDTLGREQIEQRLMNDLGAKRILWLEHGHLEGDDTDGHIDTLARLCPADTIAYVKCEDSNDPHITDLKAMEDELRNMRTADGKPYRLIPLPMPTAIYDDEQRLPATYANFLITNGAVLVPTYSQKENDEQALSQLQSAFPHHEIIGIDCRALIRQHGSLHCCTMQFP